jgi:angio-associated migratory cell protein
MSGFEHAHEEEEATDGTDEAYIDPNDIVEEYDVGDAPPEDDDDDDNDAAAAEGEDDADMADAAPAPPDQADATFTRHTDVVYCVAINPVNPTQLLTGGGDDRGFLWSLSSSGDVSACIELTGHTDTVGSVGFSCDGTLAATGGYEGKLQIWDAQTGALEQCLEGPDDVEWLAWHSKGNVILAAGQDGTVWMWLAITGECMRVFSGHESRVNCGAFTSSGKAVVTGGEDCSLRVWAPKTGECRHVFTGHGFHEGPVTCLAAHPDPEQAYLVLTGSEDGTARLCHTQSKKVLATFVHSVPQATDAPTAAAADADDDDDMQQDTVAEAAYSVESVGFCRAGGRHWCATGGADGALKVWDMTSGLCRQTCKHPAGVTRLRWHVTSPAIFTSCADGVLRLWDALSGECVRSWTGHTDMVLDFDVYLGESSSAALAAAASTHWIASASDDGTAKVFSFDSSLQQQQQQQQQSAPAAVQQQQQQPSQLLQAAQPGDEAMAI